MKEKLMKAVGRVPKWGRMVIVTVVIVAVAMVADYFVQTYIHREFCEIVEDNFSHVLQVDSVERKNGKLIIEGWVFELGTDSNKNDFDIILYDYTSDKKSYLKVEKKVRKDVNEYFLCKYDYSNVGFEASISERKISLDAINYEVLIQNADSKEVFKTGIYISKGKLVHTKPEDYILLNAVGSELEKVVNNGVLRVYRPDVGMYVYQYEDKLYWIADESYEFEEDGSTYIQYHLGTTQTKNLPIRRVEKNWSTDDKGFYFEKKEIHGFGGDFYRVAELPIPTEYSITKIWTGYYVEKEWIWQQYFRPIYEFN